MLESFDFDFPDEIERISYPIDDVVLYMDEIGTPNQIINLMGLNFRPAR